MLQVDNHAQISPEQLREVDLEGAGDLFDVHERDIALAALDGSRIVPMQAATAGECFLRKISLLPSSRDGASESGANVFHRSWRAMLGFPQPMCLRTMSRIACVGPLAYFRLCCCYLIFLTENPNAAENAAFP